MGKFADQLAPKFPDREEEPVYPKHTLGWLAGELIKRAIRKGAPLSYRQTISYRALQRGPLGPTKPENWTVAALTEYAEARLANEVTMFYPSAGQKKQLSPATVMGDFTRLTVLLKFGYYKLNMPLEKARLVLDKAIDLLKEEGIIDKSHPLDERYTKEEEQVFLDYFAEQNKHPATQIDMHEFFSWQIASARRRTESCFLLWCDWNREKHTMVVRHVKAREGRQVAALPPKAQALLESKWQKLPQETKLLVESLSKEDPKQPRIFPYNPPSVTSRMTAAGKALGMRKRLHSARRECATRLIEDDGYTAEEAIQVTKHANTAIIQKHYIKPDPSVLALNGPASRRSAN